MKTVIVGCGRVGAVLADTFDRAGHDVVVIDPSTRAFDRLPSSFGGSTVRGDGTDEDTLRRAGAENADLFISLTEGDNRNVMAAQLAHESLGARRVLAKINDPVRAEAYAHLGIATLCRTNMMSDAVNAWLGLPVPDRPAIMAPSDAHAGDDHEPVDGGTGGADAGSGTFPLGAGPAAARIAGDREV
ncbi:MAG TPA: TrkA family potassium uptake protein [Candidatus Limnocylindrales bacterium]|nr:TrkA family potassium uptake protein [Candidatus Limnocylindrales bacterium]